jgi:hypothetical protein
MENMRMCRGNESAFSAWLVAHHTNSSTIASEKVWLLQWAAKPATTAGRFE